MPSSSASTPGGLSEPLETGLSSTTSDPHPDVDGLGHLAGFAMVAIADDFTEVAAEEGRPLASPGTRTPGHGQSIEAIASPLVARDPPRPSQHPVETVAVSTANNLALPAQQAPYLTDPQEIMGEREAERVERNASLQDRMKEVAERIAELEKRAWVDDVLMRRLGRTLSRWDGKPRISEEERDALCLLYLQKALGAQERRENQAYSDYWTTRHQEWFCRQGGG